MKSMTELAGGELCLLQRPHNQVGAVRRRRLVLKLDCATKSLLPTLSVCLTLQVCCDEMERFGGESLLSGQETLTRVTAQVEGWTDCAIQLFARHNHDGATEHPNHAGMLHLTEVFLFFHHFSALGVITL